MSRTNSVRWDQLLEDFAEAKVTRTDLARSTGIPRTTILRYLCGGEPQYATGEILIEEWIRVTHRSREQVPRLSDALLRPAALTSLRSVIQQPEPPVPVHPRPARGRPDVCVSIRPNAYAAVVAVRAKYGEA